MDFLFPEDQKSIQSTRTQVRTQAAAVYYLLANLGINKSVFKIVKMWFKARRDSQGLPCLDSSMRCILTHRGGGKKHEYAHRASFRMLE